MDQESRNDNQLMLRSGTAAHNIMPAMIIVTQERLGDCNQQVESTSGGVHVSKAWQGTMCHQVLLVHKSSMLKNRACISVCRWCHPSGAKSLCLPRKCSARLLLLCPPLVRRTRPADAPVVERHQRQQSWSGSGHYPVPAHAVRQLPPAVCMLQSAAPAAAPLMECHCTSSKRQCQPCPKGCR
jgi:hypothetical protein